MTTLGAWPAVLMGLAGAGHCLGMCGSMMGAFSLTLPPGQRLWTLLLYNVGRISSYAAAGALAGALGAAISHSGSSALLVLRLIAALLLIMMGLYLLRWHLGLMHLERFGGYLWRYIAPVAKRLLPLKHPLLALPLGMLWGWLPCGLVYSALSWAVVSGSTAQGALSMLLFGLGTVPVMLATGLLADRLKNILTHPAFKVLAALVLLAMSGQILMVAFHQWS